jgi:hypothetical protein
MPRTRIASREGWLACGGKGSRDSSRGERCFVWRPPILLACFREFRDGRAAHGHVSSLHSLAWGGRPTVVAAARNQLEFGSCLGPRLALA